MLIVLLFSFLKLSFSLSFVFKFICLSLAMSELLFEGYGVPQVCYGVDALFSLYHSCLTSGKFCTCIINELMHLSNSGSDVTDALVMCSGYQTTHILPVVNGRFVASHSKRYW